MQENNLPLEHENEFQIAPAAMQAGNALANIEQSRAVAEVQAALVLAKANPRNEGQAYNAIMNSCKRKKLAENAEYSFRRGSTLVTGASIRLAEIIAQQWGNINYGFREVGRGADYSEIEAFAHDLQTNTRVVRQFQVMHIRDKSSGNVKLKAERDKYELTASMAQRRVRACILQVIPADIVDAARDACQATLKDSIGDIDKKISDILVAFDKLGVTLEDIEAYLQRSIKSLVPADVVNLQRIYVSIRDGIADKSEFFKTDKKAADLNVRFAGQKPELEVDGKREVPGSVTTEPEQTTGDDVPYTRDQKVQKAIDDAKAVLETKKSIDEIDNYMKEHCNHLLAVMSDADYMEITVFAEDLREIFRQAEKKSGGSKVNLEE